MICNCFGSFEALQVDDACGWPCPRGCRWRRQSHTGQSHTGHQSFVRSRGAQSLGGRCRRDRGCVQHCGSPNPRSNSASSARMFATGAISMPGAILPSSKRICSSSSLLLPFPCDSIFSWRLVRIVLCWKRGALVPTAALAGPSSEPGDKQRTFSEFHWALIVIIEHCTAQPYHQRRPPAPNVNNVCKSLLFWGWKGATGWTLSSFHLSRRQDPPRR